MIKSDIELSNAQVTTPTEVIDLFWRLVRERRNVAGSVLDLGAGDGRFAVQGEFSSYLGVELDPARIQRARLPKRAKIFEGCAFTFPRSGFDACIGNPPYVRHHDIEEMWKNRTLNTLATALGVKLDHRFNLYLYFMCLGILRTRSDGLLGVIVPHEWFGRPSSRPLRDYIVANSWNVDIYRFTRPIFEGALTTASITFIDKASKGGQWRHYDISPDLQSTKKRNPSRTNSSILPYENRGSIWAARGLSPGSQKIFTLTEGERIHNGLLREDVVPCVTSLAGIPSGLAVLGLDTFKKYYVDSGEKCWLIRSDSGALSNRLIAYLESIPPKARSTWTCESRPIWYSYRMPKIPGLLVSSGFVEVGPKVLVNNIAAVAVGTVYGVYGARKSELRILRDHLTHMNLEHRVIPHARTLKKIEVRQLNGVLNCYLGGVASDAKSAT